MDNTAAIHISKLLKKYDELTAVDQIDLCVQPGQFYGLLGPNGAGKTTTINIISGLGLKTSGEVKIFGKDVEQDYRACRRLVGLVPQEFNFDQFTRVKQILMFQGGYFGISAKECEKRADALLEEFDLADKHNVQARHLSGGMKRRLVIARALMHRPKLLILDEPTAGVDVDLRKSLWRFLREENERGTTILLTTHYLEEAELLCDHIGIINHGKVIAEDNTLNMLQRLSHELITVTLETPPSEAQLNMLAEFQPKLGTEKRELTLMFNTQEVSYVTMLDKLRDTQLNILSIKPSDNRLERVFMELTRSAS